MGNDSMLYKNMDGWLMVVQGYDAKKVLSDSAYASGVERGYLTKDGKLTSYGAETVREHSELLRMFDKRNFQNMVRFYYEDLKKIKNGASKKVDRHDRQKMSKNGLILKRFEKGRHVVKYFLTPKALQAIKELEKLKIKFARAKSCLGT